MEILVAPCLSALLASLVSFVWFSSVTQQEERKDDFFRDNLSVGTVACPVRLVLYRRAAPASCFLCNSPWCVLLGFGCSGAECVLSPTQNCKLARLCPLLTHSLALYYLCSHLYYALLFYFFFTPISLDSLKFPPIYYSTDDLLNFKFFFVVAYL